MLIHKCTPKLALDTIHNVWNYTGSLIANANEGYLSLVAAQTGAVAALLKILKMNEVEQKRLVVILMVQVAMFFAFWAFSFAVFKTDQKVAYKQNAERRNPRKKAKVRKDVNGWMMIWKLVGMTLLTFLFFIVGMTGLLLQMGWMYYAGVVSLIFIWTAGSILEYLAYDDNLTILNDGNKRGVGGIIRSLFNVFIRSAHKRIEKEVGGSGDSYYGKHDDDENTPNIN